MTCPTCKREITSTDNPFRPFCSERCKMIDLGRWAGGEYRLASEEKPPDAARGSNDKPEDDD
ncbi:MAG TPA: DNA gyrase inhibitor YacG [Terriglobia bacterium]|nr:DNA gyrase inhibitor YacG [Terriglobia bacterium]